MRHGRFMAAALAGAATLAIAPALASADTSPLTDDSTANFTAGTLDAKQWAVDPGSVREKLDSASYDFNDGTLQGLTATPWTMGTGTATVAAGSLSVDGERVDNGAAGPTLNAPQTIEFRATFANAPKQHIGLGNTLEDGPWALFSTGDGNNLPTGLYARTLTAGNGLGTVADTAIPGVNPTLPHTYRIEWSATDVKFYVDDVLVSTPTTPGLAGLTIV